MTPTLAHCVWPLPPKGAAAPADWQSQIHDPCLNKTSFSVLFCDSVSSTGAPE